MRMTRALKRLCVLLSMRQMTRLVIGSPGWLGIPNFQMEHIAEITADKNAETLKAFDKSQPFSMPVRGWYSGFSRSPAIS